MIVYTTEKEIVAPNTKALASYLGSIEGFGSMPAKEQAVIVREARKRYGSKRTESFYMISPLGVKVKVPRLTVTILSDLGDAVQVGSGTPEAPEAPPTESEA